MAYSLKKMWTAMAVSLVGAAGFVSAAPIYDGNFVQGDNNNCCPVSDYGSCGSLRPALDGCGNWFFSAEGLYFKASEDGLAFAAVREAGFAPSANVTATEILNPRVKWDWGVRIGAGYDFSCGWDLRAYYTHYHTKASGDFDLAAPAVESIFPLYGSNVLNGTGTAVVAMDARWKLRVDLADLELGRDFCCGPCVSVRPHVGLRAVWLNQKYFIEASDAAHTLASTSVIDSQSIFMKSEFEGIGLRTGLDTQWCVGCGFSVYGCAAASIVYGKFHNHFDETDLLFSGTTTLVETTNQFIQRDSYHASRFITDAGIGIRWSQAYCCDTVIVTLNAGWEHHLFINQNRFEDFFNPVAGTQHPQRSRGDLEIHGWTFGAKVDF